MLTAQKLSQPVKDKLQSMHVGATIGGVTIDFASLFARVDHYLPGLLNLIGPALPPSVDAAAELVAKIISTIDGHLNPAPATPAGS